MKHENEVALVRPRYLQELVVRLEFQPRASTAFWQGPVTRCDLCQRPTGFQLDEIVLYLGVALGVLEGRQLVTVTLTTAEFLPVNLRPFRQSPGDSVVSVRRSRLADD